MRRRTVDRPLLFTIIALVIFGFLIFSSASLGLLAREGARFSQVAFSQLILGIFLGGIALLIFSNIYYRNLRKYALIIFIVSLVLTVLVFIPGIGAEYSGAKRWIHIGSFSFQPAEFLKIGFVLYFAAWLASARDKIHEFRYGFLPLTILLAIIGTVLLLQPDTSTFIVIVIAALAMFFAAGGKTRDVFLFGALSVLGIGILTQIRPYIKDRLLAFFDPAIDPLGVSYQIQQSLIAIGSGQLFGRGFGQSIQKFNYLPQPTGDSIFAVAAEEFGFIGGVFLIFIFVFLAYRGLKIAARSTDYFGGLLVVGIVILIVSQSLINIASMVGVLPLTGLPLLFVSQGGSALLFTLLGMGIVLNVSKYAKL